MILKQEHLTTKQNIYPSLFKLGNFIISNRQKNKNFQFE